MSCDRNMYAVIMVSSFFFQNAKLAQVHKDLFLLYLDVSFRKCVSDPLRPVRSEVLGKLDYHILDWQLRIES